MISVVQIALYAHNFLAFVYLILQRCLDSLFDLWDQFQIGNDFKQLCIFCCINYLKQVSRFLNDVEISIFIQVKHKRAFCFFSSLINRDHHLKLFFFFLNDVKSAFRFSYKNFCQPGNFLLHLDSFLWLIFLYIIIYF